MLKIHCLQQWYNLSDPAAEDAIYDRSSFQKFLALDLISDRVPDETTILNFRHLLEKNNLSEAIFDAVNHFLEEKNLLVKEGTSLDATLIAAPTSTKNKSKSRDPEMSSAKKNNQWYFGMKAHIGVQSRGKPLVHSVMATTAKEHDSVKTYDLLHGEEEAVFGDKAYDDCALKQSCRQQGIFYGITNKAKSKHPLSNKQKKRNKQFSSVRASVEHPFQVIKCIWNYRKVRYRGLKKNLGQLNILFALSNLFMIRKQLMPISIHV
jgi:IS5 family transposase